MKTMSVTLSLVLALITFNLSLQASDSLISTQIIAFKKTSPGGMQMFGRKSVKPSCFNFDFWTLKSTKLLVV